MEGSRRPLPGIPTRGSRRSGDRPNTRRPLNPRPPPEGAAAAATAIEKGPLRDRLRSSPMGEKISGWAFGGRQRESSTRPMGCRDTRKRNDSNLCAFSQLGGDFIPCACVSGPLRVRAARAAHAPLHIQQGPKACYRATGGAVPGASSAAPAAHRMPPSRCLRKRSSVKLSDVWPPPVYHDRPPWNSWNHAIG